MVDKKQNKQEEEKKIIENEVKTVTKKDEVKKAEMEKKEEKADENKNEKSKSEKKQIKEIKKDFAIVKAYDIPISTKYSMAICKFIKNKKIDEAISQLENVLVFRRAVPMKGEIPHRHGKGMMSGRYPLNAAKNFIKLLKSLAANAQYNNIENPVIVEAVSNIGSRPFGRFGSVRKKRTHVTIMAKSISESSKVGVKK